MDKGAFEADIGRKVVGPENLGGSVPVQGNMSGGIHRDGKHWHTERAVTDLEWQQCVEVTKDTIRWQGVQR